MKKLLFFAALSMLVSFVKAEQPTSKLTACPYLRLAFETQFGPVQNVTWSQTINQLTRADFTQDGKSYAAYFDENFQYVSTVRVVFIPDLSPDTYRKAKEQLKGYAIVNVVEFWNDDMHVYFVEGRNKSKSQVVRLEAGDETQGLLSIAK